METVGVKWPGLKDTNFKLSDTLVLKTEHSKSHFIFLCFDWTIAWGKIGKEFSGRRRRRWRIIEFPSEQPFSPGANF